MSVRILAGCLAMLITLAFGINSSFAQDESDTPDEQRGRMERRDDGRLEMGVRGSRTGRAATRMRGGVPGMSGSGGTALLRNADVREELGIDADQFEQLKEAGEEMRGKIGAMMQEARSAREAGNEMPDFRSLMSEMQSKMEDKMKAILSEAQYRRMKQADLQHRLRLYGLAGLGFGETAAKLDLTQEQRDQMREKMRARFGGVGSRRERGDADGENPRRPRPDRKALTFDEVREQAGEILTEDQMGQLDELLGREFDLPDELLTTPRFGGRGGPARGEGGARRPRRGNPEENPASESAGEDTL